MHAFICLLYKCDKQHYWKIKKKDISKNIFGELFLKKKILKNINISPGKISRSKTATTFSKFICMF